MTAAFPAALPVGAALWHRVGRAVMDVILHLGAHRTATTTFQHYMRDHVDKLAAQGVGFWGRGRTRGKIFAGLFRHTIAPDAHKAAQRAQGRVALQAAQAEQRGVRRLVVSDENIIGTPRHNFKSERLYPAVGERTARLVAAFEGRVSRIVLSIRSHELWWASAAALTVARGHPVPDKAQLAAIAADGRSWRDVITDLACAAPGAEIHVIPFERFAGMSERILATALDGAAPRDTQRRWLNRSADVCRLRKGLREQGQDPNLLPDMTGRWQPFDEMQAAALRENYADDLFWLSAGADGLAKLTEDEHQTERSGLRHQVR